MGARQLIVEIVAVGPELLLGQTVNSNGAEIRELEDPSSAHSETESLRADQTALQEVSKSCHGPCHTVC